MDSIKDSNCIGPYPLIKKIGGGSFSDVYLVQKNPALALKCLKNNLPGSEKHVSSFKNEFQLLKNLNHPNITRILDFGYDDRLGAFFYTTEFIDGHNIFIATENQGVDAILDFFVQVFRSCCCRRL